MNKPLSLVLILLSLFLGGCSGGVGGTGDGAPAETAADEAPAASDGGSSEGGGAGSLVTPRGIIFDEALNRALVIDPERKAVIAIDLASGTSSIVSDSSTPNATNAFEDPRGIAMDKALSRILVVDTGRKAIIAVDLTTGARSVLSSNTVASGQVRFINPLGIVIDTTSASPRALVTDSGLHAIVAVDLSTGARTIIGNQ